ncbi:mucoidy inhibitor MuiA family protein [Dokdonia pacifica]|nr:mucoidy inhibitor MuiA family protein [Dokdonia pacifica]
MKKITLLVCMFFIYAFAKAYNESKELVCIEDIAIENAISSEISQVTVYLNGAQVERTSNTFIKAGTTTLVFNDLSNTIDENSIQVAGLGEASVLSINYGIDYLTKQKNSEEVEALQQKRKEISFRIKKINNQILGLQKEEEVINLNQKLGSTTQEIDLEKIKALATYYRQRVTAIKNEILDAEQKRQELNIELQDILKQYNELNIIEEKSTGKITLKINSEQQTTLPLKLTYTVANAGWYPIYDLKAKTIEAPLDLSYKAHVYQNTGAPWDDVSLVISTGDPSTNNIKPEVNTKYLQFVNNYYRNTSRRLKKAHNYKYNPSIKRVTGVIMEENGPLPGASVLIKGTSIGTQTDFDGRYTIDVPKGKELVFSYIGYQTYELPIYASTMNVTLDGDVSLDEVIVTAQGMKKDGKALGYAVSEVSSEDIQRALSGRATGIATNQTATGDLKLEGLTATRFEIKKNYSIPSDGDVTVIEVDTFEIPATYEYFAAPLINENVFLTASFKDWARYSLLPGEANVYFEGSFSGKTFIDPLATTEELTISLGVDPNVAVTREQVDNFKATSFIGSQRIVDNTYEIKIKNNKATPIHLKLVDRIPKSQHKEIKVDDIETGDAAYEKETGILKWILDIDSNSNAEKEFSYEIRYPKARRINL